MISLHQIPPPGTSAFNAYRRATGSSVSGAQAAYAAQQSIPPSGTSANKAYQHYIRTGQVAGTNLFPGLRSGSSISGSSTSGSFTPGSSSSGEIPVAPSSQPETFDYLDAPWASAYKMSRETAYSEALNNTAYQRSVNDMQRAGLNPAVIFGAGNGYTAGVPAYVSSPSSGSRSGSRSGSGSGYRRSGTSGKLFSSSAYSVMSALGGIVGALATKSAGGYWIGTSLTQGAMSALSLLSNGLKKR